MASWGDDIGRIVQRGDDSVLWEIPEFSDLSEEEGIYFTSPIFHLAEVKWWINLFPNGLKELDDRMFLSLLRGYSGPEKTFHCTVGVRGGDGKEEEICRQIVKLDSNYRYYILFPTYKRREDWNERTFHSSGTLTLTLRIRQEGETESQDKISQETQTDFLENTRSSREDSTSLEAKDITSRETEKEVSENSTETQEDSTSLDTKGAMILVKHIEDLLKNGEDCDVKMRVKDKEFPCHRLILKSRSPVFRMMLTHDCEENNSGVISIEDCDTEAFEELMFYMYSGKTKDLTPTKAINLYYIADKYSFPELKEQCVSFLNTSLSTTNICDIILLSAKHEETGLLNMAQNFFTHNIEEIIETVEWQNFLAKHPTMGNELYIRSLKTLLPEK